MAKSDDLTPATRLVTGGRRPEWTGPVVNPPVWRASTHLYENCAALAEGTRHNADGRFFYGRPASVGVLGYEHGSRDEPILALWNQIVRPRE